jgi:uncharacterized protein YcbX
MKDAIRRLDACSKYGSQASKSDASRWSDWSPMSICSEASLNWLNDELRKQGKDPVGKDRFRMNVWIDAPLPFMEDALGKIKLGTSGVELKYAKPAGRCIMTNIRDDGTRDKAGTVLDTLKRLRAGCYSFLTLESEWCGDPEAFFGVNCIHEGSGKVKVGDKIELMEWTKRSDVVIPRLGRDNPFGGKFAEE